MVEAEPADAEVEWIEARYALALARKTIGGVGNAQRELIRLAAAGLIRSRASLAWIDHEREDDWLIPPNFWTESEPDKSPDFWAVNWSHRDSWHSGTFERRVPGLNGARHPQEVRTAGVEFVIPDLLKWFPDPEAEQQPKPIAVPAGIQSAPKWEWEGALIALMAIAERDGLLQTFNLHKRGGQAALERWLSEWFGDRNNGQSPSPSEIRKRAQMIMAALPPA
jgi:hypothetical protein